MTGLSRVGITGAAREGYGALDVRSESKTSENVSRNKRVANVVKPIREQIGAAFKEIGEDKYGCTVNITKNTRGKVTQVKVEKHWAISFRRLANWIKDDSAMMTIFDELSLETAQLVLSKGPKSVPKDVRRQIQRVGRRAQTGQRSGVRLRPNARTFVRAANHISGIRKKAETKRPFKQDIDLISAQRETRVNYNEVKGEMNQRLARAREKLASS